MSYDDAAKTVVLFSGIRGDGSPPLVDTWTWDGCRWSARNPASAPPGRSFGAMAFDTASRKLILFGGGSANSDPARDDTWSWDGGSWTELHPVNVPPKLDHPMMAQDPDNHNLVLYGITLQGDSATWTWDGSNWTEHHPTRSPPSRGNASLAFGAKSGVLLFGGQPGEVGGLNDSWVWDGAAWSQLHPATSPEGGAAFMAHEDARHDVLMVEHDGTWIWSGNNWIRQQASTPPFQLFRSMAADAARVSVIIFGGKNLTTNGPTNDTWVWDGTAWTRVAGQ